MHPRAMIVFTHIPKTAGTTFTGRMTGAIPAGQAYIVTGDFGHDGGLAKRGTSGLSLVGGHIRFPIAWPVIGPAIYVAAVRSPLDRILSQFFFSIRQGEFPIQGDDVRSEFDRYYDAVVRRQNWLNLQCQFFSADGTFDQAAGVIERHYTAVWDSEKTDQHFSTIVALCGLKASAADADVSAYAAPVSETDEALRTGARPKRYVDFLGSDQRERVLRDNAEDARLYDWVRQNGGLRARGAS